MGNPVEFEQVQGIVRFGYKKLTECTFVLLAVQNAAAARAWIGAAPVSNAVVQPEAPQTALQIALTCEGLQRLGCGPELLSQFSMEFQSGLGSSEARARLLGDVGDSSPDRWGWGARENSVDVLLMVYARPGKLADFLDSLKTPEWDQAFHVVAELTTADLDGVEPFGFPDGLSQPEVDWERQRTPATTEDTYTNRIALGEFLLGYPNEYRHYTGRPLVDADAPDARGLPAAEDDPAKRDLGRNGCYLVLRTLEQDVAGFWNYVRAHAQDDADAEALAAKMVGRRKDGAPLAAPASAAIPGIDAGDAVNQFTFDGDPNAVRCPFGAHIRRANPRNGDLPAPPVSGVQRLLALAGLGAKTLQSDAKASARFHRIVRRGREYGPADSSAGEGTRGIHFIALGANIARQFEFLQNAWLMSTKFDALSDESDPLLGSREALVGAAPTNTYSLPIAGDAPRVLREMPRFVSVRGGAYFFLPSLPALRYLASSR